MAEKMSAAKAESAPHPDDDRKPDKLTELTGRSLTFIVNKTFPKFSKDQCTDLAAALTYYAVLALFPAILTLVSLLGLFWQGRKGTDALMGAVKYVAPSATPNIKQPKFKRAEKK